MIPRLRELLQPAGRKWLLQQARHYNSDFQKALRRTMFYKSGLIVFRILKASYLKFLQDDGFTRASTIAYSVVMSIIPLLTVLITFASVDEDVIRANIARFMVAYGITDTTEVLKILDEILGRATRIATAGLIVMMFTAANLLRHLEDSFNKIFKAPSGRPYLYRFAIYIASIVVLPGILILTGGSFQYFLNKLNPPDLVSMTRQGDSIWIVGTDGFLRKQTSRGIELVDLSEKVDLSVAFPNYYFDFYTERSGNSWDISQEEVPPEKVLSEDFISLGRITSRGDSLFLISRTGVLFYSRDAGVSWRYIKFIFRDSTGTRVPIFEDIIALSQRESLILFSIGSLSYVIRGRDNAWQASQLDAVYDHLFRMQNVNDPRGIFQSGLYVTGKGRYLFSPDGGLSWIGPFEEKFGQRSERIKAVTHDGRGGVLFGGTGGSVWVHPADGEGLEFPRIWAEERGQDIHGLHVNRNGSGFLYGSDRLFRFTNDGGRTWLTPERGPLTNQTFFAHLVLPNGTLLLGGENESLLSLDQPEVSQKRGENGLPLGTARIRELSQFPALKSAMLKTLLYVLLYLIVWSLFLAIYKFLPNVHVYWFSAAIAGFVTSLALLAFAFSFRTWITGFASTGEIYGAWAIVPVGMIVILTSAQITLFGLEIAYVLQHPHLYRWGAYEGELEKDDQLLWNSVMLVTLIYRQLYAENRPLTNTDALPYFNNDATVVEALRERLVDKNLFAYDSDSQEYFPARPPGDIKIKDVYFAVFRDALKVPVHNRNDGLQAFKGRLLHITKNLISSLEASTGSTTIHDLLQTFDSEKKSRFGRSRKSAPRHKPKARSRSRSSTKKS